MLIWRRKELENYFIDPSYLHQSSYCRATQDELRDLLIKEARQRIWLEIANHVIVSVREESKEAWMKTFDAITNFGSRDAALKMLVERPEFPRRKKVIAALVHADELHRRFDAAQQLFLDGDVLVPDRGRWMTRMSAKEVLNTLTNSKHFRVLGADGKEMRGPSKTAALIKDLLSLPLPQQPRDFQELYKLLGAVIK